MLDDILWLNWDMALFYSDALALLFLSLAIMALITIHSGMALALKICLGMAAIVSMLGAFDVVVNARVIALLPTIVHWVLVIVMLLRIRDIIHVKIAERSLPLPEEELKKKIRNPTRP